MGSLYFNEPSIKIKVLGQWVDVVEVALPRPAIEASEQESCTSSVNWMGLPVVTNSQIWATLSGFACFNSLLDTNKESASATLNALTGTLHSENIVSEPQGSCEAHELRRRCIVLLEVQTIVPNDWLTEWQHFGNALQNGPTIQSQNGNRTLWSGGWWFDTERSLNDVHRNPVDIEVRVCQLYLLSSHSGIPTDVDDHEPLSCCRPSFLIHLLEKWTVCNVHKASKKHWAIQARRLGYISCGISWLIHLRHRLIRWCMQRPRRSHLRQNLWWPNWFVKQSFSWSTLPWHHHLEVIVWEEVRVSCIRCISASHDSSVWYVRSLLRIRRHSWSLMRHIYNNPTLMIKRKIWRIIWVWKMTDQSKLIWFDTRLYFTAFTRIVCGNRQLIRISDSTVCLIAMPKINPSPRWPPFAQTFDTAANKFDITVAGHCSPVAPK